jgi:pimeloyl-ACP methyl ester carboxylesterase
LLGLSLSSCSLFKTTCEEDDRECIGPGPGLGSGLGSKCTITADCKENLVCENDRCVATMGVASCENRDGDACTDAPTTRCDVDASKINPGDDNNDQILCKEACFEACERCRITIDCSSVDYCGSRRVCLIAGDGPAGSACDDTGDCRRGLVCELPDLTAQGVLSLNDIASLSGTCKSGGTGEQGAPCNVISDCLAGLFCAEPIVGDNRKICTNLPTPIPTDYSVELPPLPDVWGGVVDCEEPDDDAPRIARFRVPRASVDVGEDFYSLPFPNDIRRTDDGKIDLSGHPVPPEALGVPFINRYAEVAQEDLEGFSTNAVAIFRFTHPYDFGTVGPTGQEGTVRLIDITPGSPDYNFERGISWKETKGTLSSYVCPHWLGISRPLGNPLLPGTTYAAIVTTGVKMEDTGDDFERDDDFVAMLSESQPSDPVLRAAWEQYKPLRDWIDDANQDPSEILNAAVFTTQDPEAVMAGLRERVNADVPAEISDITNCSVSGATSPCEMPDGEETRGECGNPGGSDFTEIHARIKLPIFQQGTAPYLDEEDGGGFELDSQGLPVIQRHEDVCMAISVPSSPPPAGGYPVLIYAHGTGGSFTNTMGSNDFARDLANASTPIAVVAIDMPEHGSRRGSGDGADQDPDGLFYNFLNPRAARDNVAQGSADLFSLVRWVVTNGGLTAMQSPTGAAVPLDATRIAMMGHSQGATHTALMVSHEPNVIAVVLSGVGGHLTSSLLTKTSPVDIASIVPIGLQDPDNSFRLAAGLFNPALSIIQSVFDSVDPINYARRFRISRLPGTASGQNVFVTYGVGDTFSPEKTQLAYLVAGRLPFVTPILREPSTVSDFDGTTVDLLAPPLSGNDNFGSGSRTIATRQYLPGMDAEGMPRDGHFVATGKGEAGRADVTRFIEQALSGQTPQIGAP